MKADRVVGEAVNVDTSLIFGGPSVDLLVEVDSPS